MFQPQQAANRSLAETASKCLTLSNQSTRCDSATSILAHPNAMQVHVSSAILLDYIVHMYQLVHVDAALLGMAYDYLPLSLSLLLFHFFS